MFSAYLKVPYSAVLSRDVRYIVNNSPEQIALKHLKTPCVLIDQKQYVFWGSNFKFRYKYFIPKQWLAVKTK